MTTTEQPPPPVFVKDPPRRSGGRTAAVAIGSIVAVLGAVLAIAGGAIAAVFGGDGVIQTDRSSLSTPTAALVSETATIDDTAGVAEGIGDARIRISAHPAGDQPLFVGVGRAADVDRYLDGVAVDRVTDLDVDPFRIDRNRLTGRADATAPGAQDFWVARSQSTDNASINWRVRDGDYRFVVMNADGSAGVSTDSRLGVKLPWIAPLGVGMLIAGGIIGALGLAGVGLSLRRR